MTRGKTSPVKRRSIVDLSWPKGLTVNSGVSNCPYLWTQFELKYPSIDSIVSTINALGATAKIFKLDISMSLRHVCIDPGDLDLLGLKFQAIWISLELSFFFQN